MEDEIAAPFLEMSQFILTTRSEPTGCGFSFVDFTFRLNGSTNEINWGKISRHHKSD